MEGDYKVMSNTIDSRVVEMQFNNKQFESGVKESLGTLDKLKSSLNGLGSGNSLTNLGAVANRVDFSGLVGAIESVSSKFSAFGIMGVTVLQHIAEEAITTGERLVKSLSVDQLSAGWSKYEQKTTAVQTIMAATADQFEDQGTQMKFVNDQLEKLNWFTDETSYNFVDMVGNIGKFTSTGIPLDSAVTSMQGIANWAAISGQNAATASRAMYNLSQAMGVGSVKLMDWRSIENANMATKEFKTQALETAASLNKLVKSADGTYKTLKGTVVSFKDFNSSLSEGWFDSEVLTQVLDKYGSFTNALNEVYNNVDLTTSEILELVDAEKEGKLTQERLNAALSGSNYSAEELRAALKKLGSEENEFGRKAFEAAQEAKTFSDAIDATKDAVSTGWMKTFELIFGNYLEAKNVWTDLANDLYDIFAAGGEVRNELLKDWGTSNWDKLLDKVNACGVSTKNFEDVLVEVAKTHGIAIDDMIEEQGSLAEVIQNGSIEAETLKDVVKEVINIISGNAPDTAVALKTTEESLAEISDVVNGILRGDWDNGVERINKLTEAGYDAARMQALADKVFGGGTITLDDLTDAELKAAGATQEQIDALRELAEQANLGDAELEELLDNLNGRTGRDTFIDALFESLGNVKDAIDLVKEAWSNVFPQVTVTTLNNLSKGFSDFVHSMSLVNEETGDWNTTGIKLKTILSSVFSVLKSGLGVIKSIGGLISQFAKSMSPITNAVGVLVVNVGNLFSTIGNKLSTVVSAIDLSETFANVAKIVADAIYWINQRVISLTDHLDGWGVTAFLTNVTKKLGDLTGTIRKFFSGLNDGKGGISLLPSIWEKLGQAFEYVKGLLKPVTDYMKNLWTTIKGFIDPTQVTAGKILKLAAGLAVVKGLFSGAGLVGNVSKFFKNLNKSSENTFDLGKIIESVKEKLSGFLDIFKSSGSITKSILMLGGGLMLLATSLLIFAAIDPGKAVQGLITMIGTVSAAATVLALLSKYLKPANLIASASAILITSVALIALAGALFLFTLVGNMDNLTNGFIAMGGSLAVVALGLGLLAKYTNAGDLLASAAAILITSAALIVLAGALALFTLVGNMANVANGFIAMGGSLMIVALGLGMLAKYCDPVKLLASATAILIASVALVAMGVALAALALIPFEKLEGAMAALLLTLALTVVGLVALGAVGPVVLVGAAALLIAAGALIALAAAIALVSIALPLLGVGLSALGLGIAGLAGGISMAITSLLVSISEGFIAITDAIAEGIANIGEGIGTGIGASIEGAATGIGAGFEIVSSAIGDGLSLIGEGIGKGFEAIGTGIADGIEKISEAIGKVSESLDGVGSSIESIGKGIESFGASVRTLDGIKWVETATGLSKIAGAIKDLNKREFRADAQPIYDYTIAVTELTNVADKITEASISIVSGMQNLGQEMVTRLTNGLNSLKSAVYYAASSVGLNAYTGANSYTSQFYSIGVNMANGLANGINANSEIVSVAASNMASKVANATRSILGIHSPSRVFAEIGKYIDYGLANGIADNENIVSSAGKSLASKLSDIQNAIDMDSAPVITPVFDLSNIRSGANEINSLFSSNSKSIGLSGSVAGSFINQNAGLNSVVTAVIDPNSLSELKSTSSSYTTDVNIVFNGSLAQLATILQPHIVAETKRLGTTLIKGV